MTEKNAQPRDAVEDALSGLRRIALGGSNDAALLAASGDMSAEEIAALDLFAVSEIRRGKEGFDIKLYSRLEALEALLAYGQRTEDAEGQSLMEALERSAQALDKAEKGDAPDAV